MGLPPQRARTPAAAHAATRVARALAYHPAVPTVRTGDFECHYAEDWLGPPWREPETVVIQHSFGRNGEYWRSHTRARAHAEPAHTVRGPARAASANTRRRDRGVRGPRSQRVP